MLGIDHQHGRFGSTEPGADPGVLGGEWGGSICGQRRAEVYHWVERTLVRHQYASLGRADKGVVRQYVARMTGLSRAQVTRLIAGHRKTGRVKAVEYQRTKFATRYTAADVGLLAYVDKAHGNLSGPATRRILEREYADYGQARLPAASPDLGGADLPIPKLGRLSQAQHQLSADAAHGDSHWRTAQTAAAGLARIPAHRHRAPRRSGWPQGHLSHQRGRPSNAMGDRCRYTADLGVIFFPLKTTQKGPQPTQPSKPPFRLILR